MCAIEVAFYCILISGLNGINCVTGHVDRRRAAGVCIHRNQINIGIQFFGG